jgi:carbamoyl-phosphate synthase small subunit
MIAKLALENGTVFTGEHFGASGEVTGEVCFNTSITGYQEILTDPSYAGQIVTMTYTQIGNYGVNADDVESTRPHVRGFIVKEYFDFHSNFRAQSSLGAWLEKNNILAIQGIDTRMLTKMLRDQGAMRGVISTIDLDEARLIAKAKASPEMTGQDLAKHVSTEKEYRWDEVDTTAFALQTKNGESNTKKFTVAVYDYGVKQNILRRLTQYGCDLTVVPAHTTAEQVLAMNPDGIFLSNGPGDPDAVKYAIGNIKKLIGKKPIFGIEITSQNHGFAVDWKTMNSDEVELTHINLNDQTVEGFRHKHQPVFCVQYHPEASPGPHDSDYLFSNFIQMMENSKG